MLAVAGTYQNGKVIFKEKIPFTEKVTVIVTFLEEPKKRIAKKIDMAGFSFIKSREILKDVKGSFSDVLIEERRSAL
ncbi:hypothetical protein PN36_26615 [Candidatus Thiomargarita nelsonii]|uniref:Uncharacterized protein n=1 Tax=Candidatus Thiomargarita nelsonii TaxID=1003181 RepID=A0A0A6RRW7_9GAMM|nr:hypothetical protein PN36_26615 [Candidatus Thiomargarita nelsonii]